jgi:hypothetical protein
MKAAFIERHGGPEVLKFGEMPDPVAASGEVVVDIVAASVNGADWKVREGKSKEERAGSRALPYSCQNISARCTIQIADEKELVRSWAYEFQYRAISQRDDRAYLPAQQDARSRHTRLGRLHWQCAAATLEAGVMEDSGEWITNKDVHLGIEAYRERFARQRRDPLL